MTFMLLAGLAVPVAAQVARLDDSSSPRALVNTDLSRAQPLDADTVRLHLGRVEYRLATAAYVGRRARIFYVVPHQIAALRTPNGLAVVWTGSGQFASGQGRPGMRVQVWSGVVRTPWLHEALDLSFVIDLRSLTLPGRTPLSFESYFEIEVAP